MMYGSCENFPKETEKDAGRAPAGGKLSLKALEESERKYATLISNLQGMAYSCLNDGNWTMQFVSAGALELTGYRPEELVENRGVSYGKIIHQEDRNTVWETIQKTLKSRSKFTLEYRIVTREGLVKWVWERGQGVFDESGALFGLEGFITDITGMKEAEKVLEESEERYRLISEMISDYAYSFRVETDGSLSREWVIGGFEKITGYTSEEVTSRGGWSSLVHPDDMSVARKRSEKLLAGLDDTSEFRIVRKDGEARWLRDYAQPVWDDAESRVVRIYGSVKDITERRKAEEEYRTLFRQMLDGFALHEIICDGNGNPADYRFLAVNPAFERMTGLKSEEIVGKTIFEVLPGTEPFWIEKYGNVALKGEPAFFESYAKMLDKYYQVSAFRPEPGKFACVFIDISDRKKSEMALKATMDRLRRITGSVIEVIIAAVEARDPYTAGHQRRVGDLARAIAAEMGLPPEEAEGIRIAGVIHDLGKISVPAEILSKPRKLSDMEFALVKEHPQKGYEILKEVDFDWPVADMVRQHHERLDGSGYPQGLKGEEIVPGAKILAVADVVEAMASHRPYRPNVGLHAALEEITSGRGVLYDPEVVDACLRLFSEKQYRLPEP